MANQFSSRTSTPSSPRNRIRQALLETLERRELLAADAAGAVFAPGTRQDYVDETLDRYLQGSANGGDGTATSIRTRPVEVWRWSPADGPRYVARIAQDPVATLALQGP